MSAGNTQYLIDNLLTEDYLEANLTSYDPSDILKYQILSEDFIVNHINYFDIYEIVAMQKVSETFIENYRSKLVRFNDRHEFWKAILRSQGLSVKYITSLLDEMEYLGLLDYVIQFQNITPIRDTLMERYKDSKNYPIIVKALAKFESLSVDFLDRYPIFLETQKDLIAKHQKLSAAYREAHELVTEENNDDVTPEQWRSILQKVTSNLTHFTLYSDHIYAYKLIRRDGYSQFNFGSKYLNGDSYDSFSDYSTDDTSFGFASYSENGAYNLWQDLYNGSKAYMVTKVRIPYENITYVGRVAKYNAILIRSNYIEIGEFDEDEDILHIGEVVERPWELTDLDFGDEDDPDYDPNAENKMYDFGFQMDVDFIDYNSPALQNYDYSDDTDYYNQVHAYLDMGDENGPRTDTLEEPDPERDYEFDYDDIDYEDPDLEEFDYGLDDPEIELMIDFIDGGDEEDPTFIPDEEIVDFGLEVDIHAWDPFLTPFDYGDEEPSEEEQLLEFSYLDMGDESDPNFDSNTQFRLMDFAEYEEINYSDPYLLVYDYDFEG